MVRSTLSEELTLAHELDHALTDQALGLPALDSAGDTDRLLAQIALVEGDATLLMQQYGLAHVSLLDQLGQLTDPAMAQAQRDLEQVPPYLRDELLFPYTVGLEYACRLYGEGGWSTVDAVYKDLPASTAEVLFDDRAGVDPIDPADPGTPPAGWEITRRDTIGAAQLLWLFGAPGGDEGQALPDAAQLASSWGGGELVLATDGDDSALGLSFVDRSSDRTLCRALDQWYDASFDDDRRSPNGTGATFADGVQSAVLRCAGPNVRIGIAP